MKRLITKKQIAMHTHRLIEKAIHFNALVIKLKLLQHGKAVLTWHAHSTTEVFHFASTLQLATGSVVEIQSLISSAIRHSCFDYCQSQRSLSSWSKLRQTYQVHYTFKLDSTTCFDQLLTWLTQGLKLYKLLVYKHL